MSNAIVRVSATKITLARRRVNPSSGVEEFLDKEGGKKSCGKSKGEGEVDFAL